MSFFRHRIALFAILCSAAGLARADTLQPLSRHDDPADVVLGQADLIARVNRGRVYRVVSGVPTAVPVEPSDLLVSGDVALRDVRPGDAIVVRIAGNPAPLADEPVGLRRVVRADPCAGDCRERTFVVASSEGRKELRLQAAQLVGRLLYVFDSRSGDLRELRDPKLPRPTSFEDAYNGWRPGWSAEALGRRLREMRRPIPRPLPPF
jgi:hypothetical protein